LKELKEVERTKGDSDEFESKWKSRKSNSSIKYGTNYINSLKILLVDNAADVFDCQRSKKLQEDVEIFSSQTEMNLIQIGVISSF
jgi:hypothetical protein